MLVAFQSPSLRGSGRFRETELPLAMVRAGFNPLHCGAVVASAIAPVADVIGVMFQSPSLRGSGRFYAAVWRVRMRRLTFQSPSLRGSGRFPRLRMVRSRVCGCFNPLRCGAVVASFPSSQTGSSTWSFNPLHCGAVVASLRAMPNNANPSSFNPLHCGAVVASSRRRSEPAYILLLFQSPSLRGSGRFKEKKRMGSFVLPRFNPLHCGAVVASSRRSTRTR